MQELSDKMGDNQFADVQCTCEDCKEDFTLKLERVSPDKIDIKGGAIGKRNGNYHFKCAECFDKDDNFGQKTHVYSRVVGYLRETDNWNDAKQAEFRMRKVYKPLDQE